MSRFAVVTALWIACVGVSWHMVFDRFVATAAVEFTREQIRRHEQGEALTSIHAGFSPRVGEAAWHAALWVSPLVAVGAAAVYLSYRHNKR